MKAIIVRQFGPPDVMKLEEVPALTPGPGQVLVRVKAIGVNPVETYVRAGTVLRKAEPSLHTGKRSGRHCRGRWARRDQRQDWRSRYSHGTAGTGAYRELTICEESQVHALPDRLSFQQGAALGTPYSTAWRALFLNAHAKPGETVLIHGASGGVGVAATQIACANGLRVIATAGTERGMNLARQQGAHEVLNHRDGDYLSRVAPLTGGRGVDLVLEMLANVNLDRDLDVLAFRGRVMVVGNRGRIEIDPRKIMSKDGAILGMTMFNATLMSTHDSCGACSRAGERLADTGDRT